MAAETPGIILSGGHCPRATHPDEGMVYSCPDCESAEVYLQRDRTRFFCSDCGASFATPTARPDRRGEGGGVSSDPYALYRDRSFLYHAYYVRGQTVEEVAGVCGCTAKTVSKWMDSFGIERRESLYPSGGEHPHIKLRDDDVADIRRRYLDGTPPRTLASEYPVSRVTITGIINGTNRPDAPGPIKGEDY